MLAASGLWTLCGATAGGLMLAMGPGPAWFAATGSLAGLAVAGCLIGGQVADPREAQRLAAVARAAGLADPADRSEDALSVAGFVRRLGKRLEKAHHFRAALSLLDAPLLVVDETGVILAASRGMERLAPQAAEGQTLDGLFGAGYLGEGGGAPEEALVL